MINRGISVLALLLVTWFFAWLWFGASFDESYLGIIRIMTLVAYLVILPGFVLVIAGRSKSRHLQNAVVAVSYGAVLVGLFALIAWWSDANHPCAGDYTQCSSILFLLSYLALQPFILLPVLFVLIVMFAVGLITRTSKSRPVRK